ILYLAGGIVGTGHHWYFTGQGTLNMGLAACFSAMEVVPLILLTLDAWDFVSLRNRQCAECGDAATRQEWAIYFLMAVGFSNFAGAGCFGFHINPPIVPYFEVGTLLTSNHGHTAMFGVFGMLALAVVVFCLRALVDDARWRRVQPLVRTCFWGLNAGLALMVVLDLFPGGVLQLWDCLTNGYWHARRLAYLLSGTFHMLEWARIVADMVFLAFGVVPIVLATLGGLLPSPPLRRTERVTFRRVGGAPCPPPRPPQPRTNPARWLDRKGSGEPEPMVVDSHSDPGVDRALAGCGCQGTLNRCLLIPSDLILASSVDAGMPSFRAAPRDPDTRPLVSAKAVS